MELNVYEQYFEAQGVFSEVERKGALVMLISDSERGMITYKAAVSFFPHRTTAYSRMWATSMKARAEDPKRRKQYIWNSCLK